MPLLLWVKEVASPWNIVVPFLSQIHASGESGLGRSLKSTILSGVTSRRQVRPACYFFVQTRFLFSLWFGVSFFMVDMHVLTFLCLQRDALIPRAILGVDRVAPRSTSRKLSPHGCPRQVFLIRYVLPSTRGILPVPAPFVLSVSGIGYAFQQ